MHSIIVTGANRGLGKELHDMLIENELLFGNLLFISRVPVAEPHKSCRYIQTDFGGQSCLDLTSAISSDSKAVVFINNAGTIEPIGKAQNIAVSDMENALRINCTAPLAISQQLVRKTKELGARLLVLNVSTGAARRPVNGWMAYCASKAAAVMALDVLASENDHVEVLHFDPGVMDTDMQSYIRSKSTNIMPEVDFFRELKTDGALKNPREVAENIIDVVRDFLL